MARELGTDHSEIEYRTGDLPRLLPEVVRHLEEPLLNVPVTLGYQLASVAGTRVKAVVGGEGADELFGGYLWLRRAHSHWMRGLMPRGLAAAVATGARRRMSNRRVEWLMRVIAERDPLMADAEYHRIMTGHQKREALRPELRAEGPDLSPVVLPSDTAESCRDRQEQRLGQDFRGRLMSGILLQHDKMSMAHSLEVRVPFLDRSVVELASAMPSHLKMHRGREKVAVSRLAHKLLPSEIGVRRKKGLAYPRRNSAGDREWQNLATRLLDTRTTGPFRSEYVERMVERWRNGMIDLGLVRVATVHLWWNTFFSGR